MSTSPLIAARQKKARKPQQRSLALREGIAAVVAEYETMTVRQLYYQMEMRGFVGKTDADYDKVQYHCLQMRRSGELPYNKIRDSSRERRATYQHHDMHEALTRMHLLYRRNYWQSQPVHVEVWCEKDALTSILTPVCQRYGITFAAMRGFDSESFTYESAQDLRALGKPARIYYFGDHDPSGWWIVGNLQDRLRTFGADATVIHAAVRPQQIRDWQLPTRRAKRSDKRYKGFVEHFGSELCTEVDAIEPDQLQRMAENLILRNIEWGEWERMKRVEALEQETLENVVSVYAHIKPGEALRLIDDGGAA